MKGEEVLTNWAEERLTAPEHVMFRELDGEAVLLNLQNEMYYGLDEMGTRMWQLLTTSDSVQAAMDTMLEEFDVSPETLEQDVAKMIQELQEQGLLESVNT
jgi:hypothetical protein